MTDRKEFLKAQFASAYGRLPLSAASWLYNLRRSARLLLPTSAYPLADQTNALSCQPLLFISAGRSGTTLLRSMLVMGEQIAIPPEGFAIPYAALQYQAMQEQSWYNLSRLIVSLFEAPAYFDNWEINMHPVYAAARSLSPSERSLARIIDLIYLHYAQLHFPNATLWGDQSIENARRLPWVMAIFPQGRYVSVLRDGRDVVASYVALGLDFDWAIARWRNAVHAVRKAQARLTTHQFLEIRYETLTTDPMTVLETVCNFAGIRYNDAMLNYWQSPTTETTQAIHRNLSKPIFKSSVGRWHERLTPQQCRTVEAQLGPLLDQLGYT